MTTASVELGSPLELGGKTTLKNRFLKSAMSEVLADRAHNPTPALEQLYRRWARGGLAVAITGNVMIDRSALGEPDNVVLDAESDREAFRRWAAAGREDGAHIWMQLNHPGKQSPAFLSSAPVAPSAIPMGAGLERAFRPPRALTEAEILALIERFAWCAATAREVGFTGVQIHGAHGYLVNQFLSARHNKREDDWGGSPERRRRFVLEIYRAIRARVGADFPVSIKLNSGDFMEEGLTEAESMEVLAALADEGIDLIEISGGTYESPVMATGKTGASAREAYFLGFAEQARARVKAPLAVTGGFRTGAGMREAVASGATDLIGLARPLAVYPDLPRRVLDDPAWNAELRRPTSGIRLVDRFTMIDVTWYEHQLHLLGAGQEPDPNASAWRSIAGLLGSVGTSVFRRRRG